MENFDGEIMDEHPHQLNKQVGLFFVVSVIVGAVWGLGSLIMILLGSLTFADAWQAGIYKDENLHRVYNFSPAGWGILTQLLFIIAYPLYAFHRNQLKTKDCTNVYWFLLNTGGILFIVIFLVNLLFT